MLQEVYGIVTYAEVAVWVYVFAATLVELFGVGALVMGTQRYRERVKYEAMDPDQQRRYRAHAQAYTVEECHPFIRRGRTAMLLAPLWPLVALGWLGREAYRVGRDVARIEQHMTGVEEEKRRKEALDLQEKLNVAREMGRQQAREEWLAEYNTRTRAAIMEGGER